jgi:predicted metal-binding protein
MKVLISEMYVVDFDQVIFDLYTRMKCMECPAFGKRYSCPPYTPLPLQAKDILKNYEKCVLLVSRIPMNEVYEKVWHLKEINRIVIAHKIVNSYKSKIHKKFSSIASRIPGKFFGVKTPCTLCKVCGAKEGKPCKYPEKRIHAPESFGIDIYGTLEEVSIPFEASVRKYATIVGMIFTNLSQDEIEDMLNIEQPQKTSIEFNKEVEEWLEKLDMLKKKHVEEHILQARIIEIDFCEKQMKGAIFPVEELEEFFKIRKKALVLRLKKVNEKIISDIKDVLTSYGIYDAVSIAKNSVIPKNYKRGLTFQDKELGLKLDLEDNEIAFLSKKFQDFKKLSEHIFKL